MGPGSSLRQRMLIACLLITVSARCEREGEWGNLEGRAPLLLAMKSLMRVSGIRKQN